MKSTTCSGTGIFFVSIFFPMGNAIGVLLHLDPSVRFGFRLLCSVNPFLPRPIIRNQRLFSIGYLISQTKTILDGFITCIPFFKIIFLFNNNRISSDSFSVAGTA